MIDVLEGDYGIIARVKNGVITKVEAQKMCAYGEIPYGLDALKIIKPIAYNLGQVKCEYCGTILLFDKNDKITNCRNCGAPIQEYASR